MNHWGGPSEPERQEATLLREFLRPLGIDLRFTARDNFLFDPGLRAGAHMFGLRFEADYLDPSNFLSSLTCAAADNLAGFCDPAYDAAYAAFAALPPGPARDDAALRLQAILGEQMPVRPIDQPSAWYLHQRWLGGLVRHPWPACASSCSAPTCPEWHALRTCYQGHALQGMSSEPCPDGQHQRRLRPPRAAGDLHRIDRHLAADQQPAAEPPHAPSPPPTCPPWPPGGGARSDVR
ncbi:hypothetical protein [Nannocystis pusilla]|uniref:hypothetical protein n=1 Tax=Nannocystis pusilla TaxID=889268 RepID=UPI003B786AFB